MSRPRLLLLTFTDVSRDPRVLRHVAALGVEYDVVTCGKGPPVAGVVEHVQIPDDADHLPLHPLGLAALLLRRPRVAYARVGAARAAAEALRGRRFDAVLSNDAITLPVAVSAAAGRPVIADLHEYAPLEMEEDWRWRLLFQGLARWLCREFLPQVAAVTTVSPGLAERYRSEFGVEVTVVTNAGTRRAPPPRRQVGPTLRLVHSGNANPNRHIETMIEGAADLEHVILDLYLVRAPRSGAYLERLRALAATTRNVRVLDPVPMDQVVSTLMPYDVGLYLLAPTSFNNLHALPNKFFDFVQAGLAIVIGPSPDMAALVERFGGGTASAGFEAAQLRETLASLTADDVERWREQVRSAGEVLCAEAEAETLRHVIRDAMAAT